MRAAERAMKLIRVLRLAAVVSALATALWLLGLSELGLAKVGR
jgi:hypothetical protein